MILLKVNDQSHHNTSVQEHRFPVHLETNPVKKEFKLKQPERLTKLYRHVSFLKLEYLHVEKNLLSKHKN